MRRRDKRIILVHTPVHANWRSIPRLSYPGTPGLIALGGGRHGDGEPAKRVQIPTDD